jgi:hypothetical protein
LIIKAFFYGWRKNGVMTIPSFRLERCRKPRSGMDCLGVAIMASVSRNEIVIALIGFLGVAFTAAVSNWDKISSHGSTSSAPIVSDNIDVQIRYFIETSGFRSAMDALEKQRAERYKLEYKADKDTVNCMLDMSIPPNQLVEITVEAFRKHFTLEEIKELNRINATPAMADFAAKQAAISLDLVSGLEEAAERARRRDMAIARGNKNLVAQSPACPSR